MKNDLDTYSIVNQSKKKSKTTSIGICFENHKILEKFLSFLKVLNKLKCSINFNILDIDYNLIKSKDSFFFLNEQLRDSISWQNIIISQFNSNEDDVNGTHPCSFIKEKFSLKFDISSFISKTSQSRIYIINPITDVDFESLLPIVLKIKKTLSCDTIYSENFFDKIDQNDSLKKHNHRMCFYDLLDQKNSLIIGTNDECCLLRNSIHKTHALEYRARFGDKVMFVIDNWNNENRFSHIFILNIITYILIHNDKNKIADEIYSYAMNMLLENPNVKGDVFLTKIIQHIESESLYKYENLSLFFNPIKEISRIMRDDFLKIKIDATKQILNFFGKIHLTVKNCQKSDFDEFFQHYPYVKQYDISIVPSSSYSIAFECDSDCSKSKVIKDFCKFLDQKNIGLEKISII